MTKRQKYARLLSLLEQEQMNLYLHPGNVIDNEIGLCYVFSRLYNQVYPESEDSFYMKMLPICEFTRIHLEALELMGKDHHPFHDQLMPIIERARECLGTDSDRIK